MTYVEPPITELWNKFSQENYPVNEYQKNIFDQYIMFAEIADRVTERRNQMNAFFITINVVLVTIIGFFYEQEVGFSRKPFTFLVLLAALALCVLWSSMLISYRKLSKSKYRIITEEYEPKLPSKPFTSEWQLCKQYKRPEFTLIEFFIPYIFGLIYICYALLIIVF